MQWPEEFEVTKLTAKINWLTALYSQRVIFHAKSSWCAGVVEEQKPASYKLAAFDEVNCQYHSQTTWPVGSIKVDCGRMTTTLDLKIIKLGLKQDMDNETFGDQFMTCSVEVGAGVGTGVNVGPLKAEAYAGGSVGAEFDRNGVTEVIVKVSAGASVGTDIIKDGSMAGVGVGDLSVDVGVTGQMSLISGRSSVESTGLLGGVFKK
jgi:hypothetical protein